MPDTGRWFAERNDKGYYDIRDESGLAHVAAVSTGPPPDPAGGRHARLIAASPDLYRACVAALAALASATSGTFHGCEEVVGRLRAALAKARTGEEVADHD
jgi:hypothetical protein